MAYLDTREPVLAGASSFAAPPARTRDLVADLFGLSEWRVILLARYDGLRSLGEPSRLARVLAALFGAPASRRLASPHLEALRRFAVLAWHHGYRLPASALAAFRGAGFSSDQAEVLLAHVAAARVAPRRGAGA